MSGFTGRYSWASYSKPKPKPRIMWKQIMGLKDTSAKIYKGHNSGGPYLKITNFRGMNDAMTRYGLY